MSQYNYADEESRPQDGLTAKDATGLQTNICTDFFCDHNDDFHVVEGQSEIPADAECKTVASVDPAHAYAQMTYLPPARQCCGYFGILCVFISWSVTIGLLCYLTNSATNQFSAVLSFVILSLYFLIGLGMIFLIYNNNDASISAMVAQRWKKASYFAILMIVALISTLATCFIFMSAGYEPLRLAYSVSIPISMYFCGMILLVPLPVVKTANQLEMHPIRGGLKYSGYKTPDGSIVNTPPPTSIYRIVFISDWSPGIFTFGHYLMIGIGYLVGVFTVWDILNNYWKSQDFIQIGMYVYTIAGIVCAFLFLTASRHNYSENTTMSIEVMFLLFHFMSMTLILYSSCGMIEVDLSPWKNDGCQN